MFLVRRRSAADDRGPPGVARNRNRDDGRENLAALITCLEQVEEEVGIAPRPRADRHSCACPVCESAMDVTADRPMPAIAEMDCRVRRLVCSDCGMQTERIFHTAFGYAPFPL